MRTFNLFMHTAVASSLLCVSGSYGSTLYGPSLTFGNPLTCTVNQTTGAATAVGPLQVPIAGDMTSDWRPATFRLWTLDPLDRKLIQINPATGLGTAIGTLPPNFTSLAFDVTTGLLYAADQRNLYLVDPATAATTLVGLTGRTDVNGLGFDLNGVLFGVGFGNASLVTLNTSTGQATTVGPLGVDSVADLAVRPDDGVMFATTVSGLFGLYQVDVASGHATLVGPTGLVNGIDGLAFSPEVPEPSGAAFALIGLAGGFAGRRRRLASHNRV